VYYLEAEGGREGERRESEEAGGGEREELFRAKKKDKSPYVPPHY